MKNYTMSKFWREQRYFYARTKQIVRAAKLFRIAVLAMMLLSLSIITGGIPCEATSNSQWITVEEEEDVSFSYDASSVRLTGNGKEVMIRMTATEDGSYNEILCEIRADKKAYRYQRFSVYDGKGSLIGEEKYADAWDDIEPNSPGGKIARLIFR